MVVAAYLGWEAHYRYPAPMQCYIAVNRRLLAGDRDEDPYD